MRRQIKSIDAPKGATHSNFEGSMFYKYGIHGKIYYYSNGWFLSADRKNMKGLLRIVE